MTRADLIYKIVAEIWGAEMDRDIVRDAEMGFEGCDGFACPKNVPIEGDRLRCDKCPFHGFWEREVVMNGKR